MSGGVGKTGDGGNETSGGGGEDESKGIDEDGGDGKGKGDRKIEESGVEVWVKARDKPEAMVETPRGGLQNDTLTARLRARADK
jgi:hypothetical protein